MSSDKSVNRKQVTFLLPGEKLTDSVKNAINLTVQEQQKLQEFLAHLFPNVLDQNKREELKEKAVAFLKENQFPIGTGVAAVVAAFIASLAVPAAVTVAGYGAGGVVAGTTAAKMMALGKGCVSLQNEMSLGVTPAAVSVLQSIGATGAISAGAQAITGGVVAGTALAGKVIGEKRRGILKKRTAEKLTQTEKSGPWKSKL